MLKPFPYQRVAISMGVKNNLLCADACGLGKTLIGIETARTIQEAHKHPILVVCKKGAKLQWEYAIEEQVSNVSIKRLDAVKNFDHDERRLAHNSTTWYIIHFAALRKLTTKHPLASIYFSTIIVDEAHRIKNRKAQQTVGTKKLVSYRKLALTATEMESSPADMWSLLNFLKPSKYSGYHGFCARYVKYEIHPYFKWKKAIGPKNLDKLARELDGTYIKRSKEEVRPDLPPLREQRVPLEPNLALQRAYRRIETAGDIVVELEEDWELIVPNVLAKIMALRQLTSNGLDRYPSDKMDYVINYVEDNPDASIVIFSVFRKTAQYLAKKLGTLLVIGGEEAPDIQKLRPKTLVGTIGALGESHDLPWMDVAIFVDVDWSSTAMQQARDRIHRITITTPKLALYLYHPGTVDNLIFDALDKKWSDIRIVQEYLKLHA